MSRRGRYLYTRAEQEDPQPWAVIDRRGEDSNAYFRTWDEARQVARRLNAEAHEAFLAETEKVCSGCGEQKPRVEFTRKASVPDGRSSQCRECTRAKGNAHYYGVSKHRERDILRRRQYVAEFRSQHPEINRAHQIVHNAVRRGDLIRPETCSACGAGGRIEGSHDDYSKPLEVVWLCVRCHRSKDRADPKSRRSAA